MSHIVVFHMAMIMYVDYCVLFLHVSWRLYILCITSCHDDCNCSTGVASHQHTTNNLFHAG